MSGLQWVLRATMPFMWGYLTLGFTEIGIALWKAPDPSARGLYADSGRSHVILSFCIWELFPQFVHLVTCVCKHAHSRPDSHCVEFAKNAAIVMALGIPIFGLMPCIIWINDYPGFGAKWERALVFVGCFLFFAIFCRFGGCLINRIAGEPEVTEEVSESFGSEQPHC
eukprot:Skav211634  [mRNA]  locus=scaffold2262:150725:151228:+ [translate_table: standard]